MFSTSSRIALIAAIAMPGAALAQAGDNQVEEIVVTAQRREQNLQDVPVTVSAVTGQSLERAGITDTRQLTQMLPALVFSRANSSFQPYIRGVGTRNANVGDESNVSVYIDGVYQPIMSSLGFDLMNVQRVEVLRGPQGTLFGRNSTGGLINVITTDPTEDLSGKIQLRGGNFGEFSAQGYVASRIVEGLRGEISYARSGDKGYIRDLVRGGHAGDRDSELIRGKLLLEPNDSFRAALTATFVDITDGSSVNNQPLNGNTIARTFTPTPLYGQKSWESALDRTLVVSSRQKSLDFQTRFKLDGFNVETTTAYQKGEALSQTDNDGSTRAIAGANVNQVLSYTSNEVRLLSTTDGPLSWIVGGYMFSGKGEFRPLIAITNGIPGLSNFTKQTVDSTAVFGEATYAFGDSVRLTGGLRYTDEERDYQARTSAAVLVPLQNGGFNKLTYRATLQYLFSPDANVYATYSRGFKSGVFNGFATSLAAAAITRPEILDAIEVGLKADPAPWVRINLSAFHYDYKDIQQSARSPTSSLIVLLNAAKSKMNGAEAEVTLRPSENLNLRAYATYLDAKYDEFLTAQVFSPRTATSALPFSAPCPVAGQSPCGNISVSPLNASGKRMIRAPKFTFGANFDYSMDVGTGVIGLSGNAYYSGKYYWDFENRIVQPSYVQLNGEVSFATSDSDTAPRFSVWGRNLANEVVYAQVLTAAQGDVVGFERPRSYGVSVSKRF